MRRQIGGGVTQPLHISKGAICLVVLLALAGCGEGLSKLRQSLPFGNQAQPDQAAHSSGAALDPKLTDGSQSQIISTLLARPTVLKPGVFARVSDAVMAANSRRAEAELRAAMLNSEATQKNWLPTLGPTLSLNSLGNVVAGMVVNQALFDGGRRKAERAVSRADVEVAAVALSQNSNDRVRQALELYIDAEAARARARVLDSGMERMEHFAWVMGERVRGGVNDPADLQLVQSQVAQLRSDLSSDREKERAARAELAAMSAQPLEGVVGLSEVGAAEPGIPALAVLKAEAEVRRADAAAAAAKAGFLPQLGLNANVTAKGIKPSLDAGFANGIGLGMGARREAIEAERQAAHGRLVEAREASNRAISALQGRLAEAARRLREARNIAAHAEQNYKLFAAQLEAGRRAVPDVIGVFETKLRTARAAVDMEYELARLRVKLAALQGVLVQGDKV